MINFDTLFQFLSLCHEFNLTAQALEVIHGNISAQYQLIEACQAYLALLDQFATLPSSPGAPSGRDSSGAGSPHR